MIGMCLGPEAMVEPNCATAAATLGGLCATKAIVRMQIKMLTARMSVSVTSQRAADPLTPNGEVGDDAKVLQTTDLAQNHTDKSPDQNADGEAKVAL